MEVCAFSTSTGSLFTRDVARKLSGDNGRRVTCKVLSDVPGNSTGNGRPRSTRRAFLLDVTLVVGGALSCSTPAVQAANKYSNVKVSTALSGVVRVRDGVSDLIDGDSSVNSSIDINRAIKLLVKGTDLKGDGDKLSRALGNEEITDAIRDAREMMDLATQYYFLQGKKAATPQQTKVTAEALGKARELLDTVINRFDDDVVKEARLIVSGPI